MITNKETMRFFFSKRFKILALILSFSLMGAWVQTYVAFAQTADKFFVDSNHDAYNRQEVIVTLVKLTPTLYWYAESEWWNPLSYSQKSRVEAQLDSLSREFDSKIYPILTSTLGQEWKPGIDNDPRIFVLIHRTKKEVSGYWRPEDEYERPEAPLSNQKEIIYLSADRITEALAKTYLAHEFTHLIVFNQADKKFFSEDEIWFQEMIAELASTILGYDDIFAGSNLEQRVKKFLSRPSDSLYEWNNDPADYGVANLFGQYFLDHYGLKMLVNALKIPPAGINAINTALAKGNFKEDFSKIFTDWTIALNVQNCEVGKVYCYLSSNLKSVKIVPSIYFLPLSGDSTLSVSIQTKNWAGNWHKFIGGHGTLILEFDGPAGVNFRVPYVLELAEGGLKIMELEIKDSSGRLEIPDFGVKIKSLVIIPTVQQAADRFIDGKSYTLSWTVLLKEKNSSAELSAKPVFTPVFKPETPQKPAQNIEELQKRILELKALISSLQAQLAAISGGAQASCGRFERDLYYGLEGSEITCLQQFLKDRGSDIYPEGLVTGRFLGLTKAAVVRFQEKYSTDVLSPLGLNRGTGFVGLLTRAKINQMLQE